MFHFYTHWKYWAETGQYWFFPFQKQKNIKHRSKIMMKHGKKHLQKSLMNNKHWIVIITRIQLVISVLYLIGL